MRVAGVFSILSFMNLVLFAQFTVKPEDCQKLPVICSLLQLLGFKCNTQSQTAEKLPGASATGSNLKLRV